MSPSSSVQGRTIRESGGKQNNLLERDLKVPRQCPLVLLVVILLQEDEASGSEKYEA
jgi:hypothetical protein